MAWPGRYQTAMTLTTGVMGLAFGLLLTAAAIFNAEVLDPLDRHPLVVGLARAHADLNAAVGFDRWDKHHLTTTAADLRALARRYDNAGPMLEEAALRIDDALADDDRSAASTAHTIVDRLEVRVREQLRRERAALHLPAA